MTEFITDIGLEIHVQLDTKSKAFSSEPHRFGADPNTQVSSITLALPGTLPVVNRQHLALAIRLGLACQCEIEAHSRFDRKNYVYPDLPKSYQITQDQAPICKGGEFRFFSGTEVKTITLHHIHMEEDAGKSIHDLDDESSLIDLNRAGTPLVEVVTEPDFHSARDVYDFIDAFQVLLRHLEVSDANMEEGSLRMDCNVSLRKHWGDALGTRTEIKNINSKKFARQAIEFEIKRQAERLNAGLEVEQETRLFDPLSGETFVMRKKEDALDYRYFPEPDLYAIELSSDWLHEIGQGIGILPFQMESTLIHSHGISPEKAAQLSRSRTYSSLFPAIARYYDNKKNIVDFLLNQGKQLDEIDMERAPRLAEQIGELLSLIDEGRLSASIAYKALLPLLDGRQAVSVETLAAEQNILIESGTGDQSDLCKKIIEAFPEKQKAYRQGKKNLIGFFMGQFMRQTNQPVQPQEIQSLFEKLLNSDSD